MNIYFDFEATQFKENIIAIGAFCDANGEEFDCLVKPPRGDKVTPFISNLTGITKEMSKNALSIEEAFSDLYNWITVITSYTGGPLFYHAFGNMDKIFLQNTAQYCKDATIKNFMENLANSLIDDSIKVCQYFHMKSIGVYRALRYFEKNVPEQDHDPLNDAIALFKVIEYISIASPLEKNPFTEKNNCNKEKIPKDYCIVATHTHEQGAKPKYFCSIEEAERWVLQKIHSKNKDASRTTIIKNFQKALKNNANYNGWHWRKNKK